MPQEWPSELSRYFLVGCVFLAASHALKMGLHVRTEILILHLSRKRQVIAGLVSSFLGFVYCAIMTWQSVLIAFSAVQQGWTAGGTTGLPESPARIIIPAGCFVLCLVLIGQFVSGLRELSSGEDIYKS